MSAGIAGGALLQMPMGWLSDRYDRRSVMLFATAGASIAGIVLAAFSGGTEYAAYATALLFGAFAMPLYSLSAAHANDFAKPDQYSTVAAGVRWADSTRHSWATSKRASVSLAVRTRSSCRRVAGSMSS